MKLALPLGRYYLRLLKRSEPVPVSKVFTLRRMSFGGDSLVPPNAGVNMSGSMLSHPMLSRVLANEDMGKWSMCPATLNFLESRIRSRRPKAVLELGSGLSTICLAQYMDDVYKGAPATCVYSLEQDSSVIDSTRRRLTELQLAERVELFHCPLAKQKIAARETSCYSLSASVVALLKEIRPELVVIDGPAAEDGARFGTLPLIRDLVAESAEFYLDDALRDGELEAARCWNELPRIDIKGILPTEKGLLVGRICGF